MTTCATCGTPLGVGRFCTGCGARIADAAPLPDAAPIRPSTAPPTAHEVPPPARYPLWAEEPAPTEAETTRIDLPVVAVTAPRPVRARRRPGVLLAAAVAAVVVLAGVAVLATRSGQEGTTPAPAAGGATGGVTDGDAAGPLPGAGDRSRVRVTAPPSGPPSTDVATGARVTYGAANLLDGDPTTAWRTPGDASGAQFVLRLPPGSTLTSLSLVNGYAKTSVVGERTYDWYAGGRRVLRVRWTFDDGTSVDQRLIDTRDPQRLDVGAVRTRTVRLTLLEVSAPGSGPARRDATAISEIGVVTR